MRKLIGPGFACILLMLVVATLAFVKAGDAHQQSVNQDQKVMEQTAPLYVPLLALLITPERYEGKKVRVIGYVTSGEEFNVVYSHREDASLGNFAEGVWLENITAPNKGQFDINNKYCLLEGTFTTRIKGHLQAYQGALKDIDRVVLWIQPEKKTTSGKAQ